MRPGQARLNAPKVRCAYKEAQARLPRVSGAPAVTCGRALFFPQARLGLPS